MYVCICMYVDTCTYTHHCPFRKPSEVPSRGPGDHKPLQQRGLKIGLPSGHAPALLGHGHFMYSIYIYIQTHNVSVYTYAHTYIFDKYNMYI